MFPYVPPKLQTADEITMQQLTDDGFIELESKFTEVSDSNRTKKTRKSQ